VNRRRFAALAGAAVLSGCGARSGDEGAATRTPTRTQTSTPAPTGTPPVPDDVAGAFDVTVDAPPRIEINEGWGFGVRARNTTERALTFASPLSFRARGGDWRRLGTLSIPAAPGESGSWRSPTSAFAFLGRYDYRLDATGRSWSVEVERKGLDFGLTYTSPRGLVLVVEGVSFSAGEGGDARATATFAAENRSDGERTTPAPETVPLAVDGDPRAPTGGTYAATTLAAGERTRGTLAYPVPAGTRDVDVSLSWERTYDEGRVAVTWDK
jgi:hypothetical protein